MSDIKTLQKSLKLVKKCPVCQHNFTQQSAQVVDNSAKAHLVYFYCNNCKTNLLAQVLDMPFGLVGTAMLTELEVNEVQKFKKMQPVDTEDALNVYEHLIKNNK